MNPVDWYRQAVESLRNVVAPYQWIVTAALLVIIGVTVLMLFERDPVKRTGWAIFMWLP